MGFLPIPFTKMSGAGNTFVLAKDIGSSAWGDILGTTKISASEFAKKICDPIHGVCADGMLVLSEGDSECDYKWEFYNADGSTAEMCGNAARCAARYCHEIIEKKQKAHFKFKTGAGIVEAMILGNGLVRVQMPEARVIQKNIELATNKNTESFSLVNTGVPHLVQKIHHLKDAYGLKEMAREVRGHHDLKPNGANVTFYSVDHEDKIQAVTFERGVENFTLACGTGAVAAAFVQKASTQNLHNFEVTMPGGSLRVFFPEGEARPYMEGEAVFIGDFNYSLEVFI